MAKVFISYASQDEQFAERLDRVLRRAGHDPWYAPYIEPGADFKKVLAQRMRWCSHFIYVLTPDWITSDYCRWEFDFAKRLRKVMIPLLAIPTAIPATFSQYEYIDFTLDDWTPQSLGRLMSALSARPEPSLTRTQIAILLLILLLVVAGVFFMRAPESSDSMQVAETPPSSGANVAPTPSDTLTPTPRPATQTPSQSSNTSTNTRFINTATFTATPTLFRELEETFTPRRIGIVQTQGEANARIRSGPGSEYSLIGVLGYGTQIVIYGLYDEWYFIGNGWVLADLVLTLTLEPVMLLLTQPLVPTQVTPSAFPAPTGDLAASATLTLRVDSVGPVGSGAGGGCFAFITLVVNGPNPVTGTIWVSNQFVDDMYEPGDETFNPGSNSRTVEFGGIGMDHGVRIETNVGTAYGGGRCG